VVHGKNMTDADSFSRHFPDWLNVRSAYNKRRQRANISFADPYKLPIELEVTKMASVRLVLGNEVDNSDR
jgi:hypothetical protein